VVDASTEAAARAALGRRVREARQARGATLREVAGRLGVSAATWSAVENGHTGLSAVRLAQVAELLGASVEQLLHGDPSAAAGEPTYAAGAWRRFGPLTLDPTLAGALSAFAELGYHGATVRDIARRAGLSVPGVYHHRASKQEMLVALLDLTMEDLLARSHAAREEGTDPAARLGLLVECLVLFHTHRREQAFIGASEMRSLEPEAWARVAALRTAQQRMVDDEVERGCRDGVFATGRPREAARAIVTMCTAVPQWFSSGGPASAEWVAQQYVEFALDVVRHRR
jgi:AcrR family transcriptional regulator/DNA-binding XRE family transcriptional regulator